MVLQRTHGVADLLAMPLATPPLSPTRAVLIHPAHSRHNPVSDFPSHVCVLMLNKEPQQATIQDLSPELVENIISRLDNKALEAVVTTSRYYSAVAFREIMHRSQLLQPDVSLFMRSEFGALPHLFRVSRCPKGRIGATFMLNRSETDRQMQLLERYFLRLPLGTPLRRIDLQILTSAGALPLAQLLHSIGRITCEHMDIEVHEAPDDAEKDVAVLTVPTVPQLNSLSINGRVFFMQPVYNWTRQALILGSLHSLDLCAAGLPADEWKALLEWTTLPQLKYFTFVGTVPPAVLRDFLDRHPIIRDLTLGQVSAPSHGVELRPRIPKLLGVQTLSVNATYLSHLLNGTNAPRLRTLTIVLQKPGAAKALASLSLLAHCPTLYSIEFEISSSGAGLMKQVMEGLAVRSTLMHTVHRLELTSACSSTELHGDLYVGHKHFPI